MNFCTEGVGTDVCSNQVEADGFEARKLLKRPSASATASSGPVGLCIPSRGFLVEHFVRPPATVSVKFPVCIDISHIVINPKVGSQISTAFSIETESSYNKRLLVGKEFLSVEESTPSKVVFRNPRFVSRQPFSLLKDSTFQASEEKVAVFDLKHPMPQACEKINKLHVTILRVVGSSVPALGGLEIWGQPCRNCPKTVVDKLLANWLRISRKRSHSDIKIGADSLLMENETTLKRSKVQTASSIPVPEEFLDPITQEIMCQPIRLPSGTAVDASTLEKYYHEESVWGRGPNDPFTAQPYTDTVKPVADGGLKARIDYFLTQHSSNPAFTFIPRTLGRGNPVNESSGYEKKSIETNYYVPQNADDKVGKSAVYPEAANLLCLSPIGSAFSSTMEERLHNELQKILGKKDSTKTAGSPVKPSECFKCTTIVLGENSFNTASIFYRNPCQHVLVCATCIKKLDKEVHFVCESCRTNWAVKDLQRAHS